MIILRQRIFSESKESEEKEERRKTIGAASALAGAGVLATTRSGHLTGTVTRYHNTERENVKDILEHGIKSKFAEDPRNLTNVSLPDIPMEAKRGLVYTAKKKSVSADCGMMREWRKKHPTTNPDTSDIVDVLEYVKGSRKSKTLKLKFDYDDIKSHPRVDNPELRGAKNWKEYKAKTGGFIDLRSDDVVRSQYNSLGGNTHVFRGDIDPSHIVGSRHYKKRTLEDVKKYIKNNPKRFGKEAAKVALGAGLVAGGITLATKKTQNKKKESEKTKDDQ